MQEVPGGAHPWDWRLYHALVSMEGTGHWSHLRLSHTFHALREKREADRWCKLVKSTGAVSPDVVLRGLQIVLSLWVHGCLLGELDF